MASAAPRRAADPAPRAGADAATRRLDRIGGPACSASSASWTRRGRARCSTSPRSCAVPIGSPPSATRTPTVTRSARRSPSPWPQSASASRQRWSAATRCRHSSPSCPGGARATHAGARAGRGGGRRRGGAEPDRIGRDGARRLVRAGADRQHRPSRQQPRLRAAVWIDPRAAATCEMVTLLLPELGRARSTSSSPPR